MGYNYEIYKIPISELEAIRDLSAEELSLRTKSKGVELWENGGFWLKDPKAIGAEFIYDFGPVWDDEIYDKICCFPNLLSKRETQNLFPDNRPTTFGKEGLMAAIDAYHKKTVSYYKGLLADDVPNDKFVNALWHTEDRLRRLSVAVDVNEENKWQVTNSSDYELAIFNLVHILKTMDWTKDTLIMIGG